MRRSVREAMVGFTLIAALTGSGLFWLWLRGVSLASRTWRFQLNFADASGLAERSAVTYRGVLVGNVNKLTTTSSAVVVELEIDDPSLQLPLPLVAQVQEASLLGGDAVVALIASSRQLPAGTPGPTAADCNRRLTVCAGNTLNGVNAASISSLTVTMQKLLEQVDRENLVPELVKTTRSFDLTAKEATKFLEDGQQLIKELEAAVNKAQPTIDNLNASTASIRNFTHALDNPKTVSELKTTVTNAEKLTARWNEVGGDVEKLTADPRFMNGLRSVSIGLGKFFDELYPAQTGSSKEKPVQTGQR
ncbi:MAG: MCE family protein [Cyanobacteria bacterium M_surface_10_m2_179]|nr:MCE family protein [Cyanobacteria bacterium M_surface_10_m2_179]